jgi:hypothetical protein
LQCSDHLSQEWKGELNKRFRKEQTIPVEISTDKDVQIERERVEQKEIDGI